MSEDASTESVATQADQAATEATAPPRPALAAVIGLAAGLAAGLLGIGGGLVMVPLLVLWVAMPIKRAVGTSLLGVLALSAMAVIAELVVQPSNVHWAEAGCLAAGAVAGSWIGTRIIVVTPPRVLTRLLALVLIAAAARLVFHDRPVGDASSTLAGDSTLDLALAAIHVATGLAAGVISALFGVGGGILAVPALSILHPAWPFQAWRATSLAMIVPTSLAGAALHRRLRHVDAHTAWALVPAGLAGAALGVVAANRVPGRPLELLFAALLVVSAVRLARK